MGNNNEKSISAEERDLFHKVAQDIKDRPAKYREAGKWLDEYCGEDAYWQRQEKELKELRRKEREFPNWPIPKQVRQLEQEIEQRRTPALAVRFQEARDYLFEKYKQQQFIPEDDAKRIILIAWLLTDPDAEKADLAITELEKWTWEPLDDVTKMSRGYANFLWFHGGKVYRPWMNLVRIAWSKLAEGMDEKVSLSTEVAKETLANFFKNLVRASIKHFPFCGPFLYDVIYGTIDTQASQKETIGQGVPCSRGPISKKRKTIDGKKADFEKWYQNRTIQGALIAGAVLLLVSIGGWLITLHVNKSQTDSGEAKPILSEHKLLLSLRALCQDIDSRPLLQREETAKRYVGMRIKRESLSLFDISEEDENFLILMVFPGESYVPFSAAWGVSFRIKVNDYPELASAKQGVRLYVSGRIQDIGERFIHLSNVSLSFD